MPGQKEDERRLEARRVCRAKGHEVLTEVLGDRPVLCRDGGWNGKIWNVLWEGWRCDDALGAPVGVCESGVAENGIDDGDGRLVGSVMLQVNGVDVHGVGESGQSGSWENVVDHGVVQVVNVSFVMCDGRGEKIAWDVVVVRMDRGAVGPWHVGEKVEVVGVVPGRVEVGRMEQ